jgi:hypothetical protein
LKINIKHLIINADKVNVYLDNSQYIDDIIDDGGLPVNLGYPVPTDGDEPADDHYAQGYDDGYDDGFDDATDLATDSSIRAAMIKTDPMRSHEDVMGHLRQLVNSKLPPDPKQMMVGAAPVPRPVDTTQQRHMDAALFQAIFGQKTSDDCNTFADDDGNIWHVSGCGCSKKPQTIH